MKNQPVTASKSHKRLSKEQGQGLIEFSLVLPILLLVIFGIIDYGRVLFIFSDAANSIRDGSRNATLVGQTAGGAERYRACDQIEDDATDILFGQINGFHILYYDTIKHTTNDGSRYDATATADAAEDYALAIEDATAGDVTTLEDADYDCGTVGSLDHIDDDESSDGSEDIKTGDLMVIVLELRVEFLTPIMSSFVPGFDFQFRGQRTVVTDLVLNISSRDRDRDGLPDSWEAFWFGCHVANTSPGNNDGTPVTPAVAIQQDGTLIFANTNNEVGYLDNNYRPGNDPANHLITGPDPRDNPNLGTGSYTKWTDSTLDNAIVCAVGPIPTRDLYNDEDGDGVFRLNELDGTPADFEHYQCGEASAGVPFDSGAYGTPNTDPDGIISDCMIPATAIFNSVSDPNGDGLSTAAEAARGLAPIDLDGINSRDEDNDGLTTITELGIGTNPTDRDSDRDGILDGDEQCSGNPATDPPDCLALDWCSADKVSSDPQRLVTSDPNRNPPNAGCFGTRGALTPDTDNDGIDDFDEIYGFDMEFNGIPVTLFTDPTKGDTDEDGIGDGDERDGVRLRGLVINGQPQGGLLVSLNPTVDDTDGDGLLDGEEVNGRTISNNFDGTLFNIITNPADPDTDDDGICDGDGTAFTGTRVLLIGGASITTCSGIADVNPIKSDTDGDLLPDGVEQLIYFTFADNVNSDGDACFDINGNPVSLDDGFELTGSLITDTINPDAGFVDSEGNPDTGNNALDLNSDQSSNDIADGTVNGVFVQENPSDCEEVAIFGINPYDTDTDGDGFSDVRELALTCLENGIENTIDDLDCEDEDLTVDSDNDGLPDAWELSFRDPANPSAPPSLGTLGDPDADPDADGLTNRQELEVETNPLLPDSDFDGIRDGFEVGTNRLDPDSDSDGIPDGYEDGVEDPNNEGTYICRDPDNTGPIQFPIDPATGRDFNLANAQDRECHPSSGLRVDTDDDRLTDFDEIYGFVWDVDENGNDLIAFTRPNDKDTDGDGINDADENAVIQVDLRINGVLTSGLSWRLNPMSIDTDNDGLSDFIELNSSIENRTNPRERDTDGDGLIDGSLPGEIGERDNSYLTGIDGFRTRATLADSDDDGLLDWQEIYPGQDLIVDGVLVAEALNPYEITIDNITSEITLPGYNRDEPNSTVRLNPLNDDVDGDGLEDGFETTIDTSNDNDYITNPLVADTDDDGFTDSEEIDGDARTGTNPIITDAVNDNDPDGDGLLNADEISFETDTNDPDTDNDGLLDNTEFVGVSITYYVRRYDSGTNSLISETITVTTNTEGSNNQGNGAFDYSDGYDTDMDGLADGYEIYYANPGNLDRIGGFTRFVGNSGSCPFLENNSLSAPFIPGQPLNPNLPDTDGDGLTDLYECQNNTNPFDAAGEISLTGKITDPTLRQAVTDATGGDTIKAASRLPERLDGRVEVRIRRSDTGLLGSALLRACGPASTDTGTSIANICGNFINASGQPTTSEPRNEPGSNDDVISVLIAPSAVIDLIEDASVNLLAVFMPNQSGSVNQVPQAIIDSISCNGLTCTFDASGSVDPENDIISYRWEFGDGNIGSGVTDTHTYSGDATVEVVLTVTDGEGAVGIARQGRSIGSGGGGNTPPTAGFTFNCTDLRCDFDAVGGTHANAATPNDRSNDTDGTLTNSSFAWDLGDANSTTASGEKPSFVYPAAGTYTVELTVTDSIGATATATANVTVTAPVVTTVNVGVSSLDRDTDNIDASNWRATAQVVVVDENNDNPVEGVRATGTFSNSGGTGTCVTDRNGFCEVNSGLFSNTTDQVTFTIDSLSDDDTSDNTDISYRGSAANVVSSIQINRQGREPFACEADYTVTGGPWAPQNNYNGRLTIRNVDVSSVRGWTMVLTFNNSETIDFWDWNSGFQKNQNGQVMTVVSPLNNANLLSAGGDTVTSGFGVQGNGSPLTAPSIVVNGQACTVNLIP